MKDATDEDLFQFSRLDFNVQTISKGNDLKRALKFQESEVDSMNIFPLKVKIFGAILKDA